MRKGFGVYIPPHRRRDQNEETPKPPRALADLAGESIEITVQYSADATLPAECIQSCLFHASLGEGPGILKVTAWRGLLLEEQIEFLRWCKAQVQFQSKFKIHFPCSLSKSERALWHRAAEESFLFSHAKGIDASRRLIISSENDRFAYSKLTTEQRVEVDRVYFVCQSVGGPWWEISRNEIAEMLISPEGLSAPILELLKNRNSRTKMQSQKDNF